MSLERNSCLGPGSIIGPDEGLFGAPSIVSLASSSARTKVIVPANRQTSAIARHISFRLSHHHRDFSHYQDTNGRCRKEAEWVKRNWKWIGLAAIERKQTSETDTCWLRIGCIRHGRPRRGRLRRRSRRFQFVKIRLVGCRKDFGRQRCHGSFAQRCWGPAVMQGSVAQFQHPQDVLRLPTALDNRCGSVAARCCDSTPKPPL